LDRVADRDLGARHPDPIVHPIGLRPETGPTRSRSSARGFRRTTQRAGDPARRWFFATATIVLIGIGLIIVLSVGGLLVSIALPAFMRAREKAREHAAMALDANAITVKSFTIQDPTIAGIT
jgi:hypothetical protein